MQSAYREEVRRQGTYARSNSHSQVPPGVFRQAPKQIASCNAHNFGASLNCIFCIMQTFLNGYAHIVLHALHKTICAWPPVHDVRSSRLSKLPLLPQGILYDVLAAYIRTNTFLI